MTVSRISEARYLSRAHATGRLIPVIGAGFGSSVAQLPSWPALLDRGIEFAKKNAISATQAQLTALRNMRDAGDLLSAFDYLQDILADDDHSHYSSLLYHAFLNEVFHSPPLNDQSLIDALSDLSPRVCVTTNYDTLLEDALVTQSSESSTWLTVPAMRGMLRMGRGVVHLHGRYDRPESVILSKSDYQRIVSDRDATAVSEALFHSGVLVFIGISFDGVTDPHLSGLLERFAMLADRRTGEQYPHVLLTRGTLNSHQLARCRAMGIEPLSYGDTYADLPRFISTIGRSRPVRIEADVVTELERSSARAQSRGEHLRNVEHFIRETVFADRSVRISYAEFGNAGLFGAQLKSRHVVPPNASHSVFSYPVSIAAWSLIEGNIIAWPFDAHRRCNFARLRSLDRLDTISEMLSKIDAASNPELSRYIDVDRVRERFDARELVLSDFFQDWGSTDPTRRYSQFVSVPVPIVDSLGNTPRDLRQRGVFNIDTTEPAPLLSERTAALLRLASAAAEVGYVKPE